jgi:hypothetical protein
VHSLRISVPWVISFRPSVATIWSMLAFSSTIACRSIWPTGRIRHFAYSAGSSAQYNSFSCSSRSVNRGSKRNPNQCRMAKLALLTLCMSSVIAVGTMSDVLRYQISNT